MRMLMVNKEAQHNKTRTASPTAIPYSRGQIAEQAAAVKGNMNGAILRLPMTAAARPALVVIKGATD